MMVPRQVRQGSSTTLPDGSKLQYGTAPAEACRWPTQVQQQGLHREVSPEDKFIAPSHPMHGCR